MNWNKGKKAFPKHFKNCAEKLNHLERQCFNPILIELQHLQKLADVRLEVNGDIIRCHAIILATHCALFEDLLSQLPPLPVYHMILDGWDSEIVRHFVSLLYVGHLEASSNVLTEVQQLAKYVKFRGTFETEVLPEEERPSLPTKKFNGLTIRAGDPVTLTIDEDSLKQSQARDVNHLANRLMDQLSQWHSFEFHPSSNPNKKYRSSPVQQPVTNLRKDQEIAAETDAQLESSPMKQLVTLSGKGDEEPASETDILDESSAMNQSVTSPVGDEPTAETASHIEFSSIAQPVTSTQKGVKKVAADRDAQIDFQSVMRFFRCILEGKCDIDVLRRLYEDIKLHTRCQVTYPAQLQDNVIPVLNDDNLHHDKLFEDRSNQSCNKKNMSLPVKQPVTSMGKGDNEEKCCDNSSEYTNMEMDKHHDVPTEGTSQELCKYSSKESSTIQTMEEPSLKADSLQDSTYMQPSKWPHKVAAYKCNTCNKCFESSNGLDDHLVGEEHKKTLTEQSASISRKLGPFRAYRESQASEEPHIQKPIPKLKIKKLREIAQASTEWTGISDSYFPCIRKEGDLTDFNVVIEKTEFHMCPICKCMFISLFSLQTHMKQNYSVQHMCCACQQHLPFDLLIPHLRQVHDINHPKKLLKDFGLQQSPMNEDFYDEDDMDEILNSDSDYYLPQSDTSCSSSDEEEFLPNARNRRQNRPAGENQPLKLKKKAKKNIWASLPSISTKRRKKRQKGTKERMQRKKPRISYEECSELESDESLGAVDTYGMEPESLLKLARERPEINHVDKDEAPYCGTTETLSQSKQTEECGHKEAQTNGTEGVLDHNDQLPATDATIEFKDTHHKSHLEENDSHHQATLERDKEENHCVGEAMLPQDTNCVFQEEQEAAISSLRSDDPEDGNEPENTHQVHVESTEQDSRKGEVEVDKNSNIVDGEQDPTSPCDAGRSVVDAEKKDQEIQKEKIGQEPQQGRSLEVQKVSQPAEQNQTTGRKNGESSRNLAEKGNFHQREEIGSIEEQEREREETEFPYPGKMEVESDYEYDDEDEQETDDDGDDTKFKLEPTSPSSPDVPNIHNSSSPPPARAEHVKRDSPTRLFVFEPPPAIPLAPKTNLSVQCYKGQKAQQLVEAIQKPEIPALVSRSSITRRPVLERLPDNIAISMVDSSSSSGSLVPTIPQPPQQRPQHWQQSQGIPRAPPPLVPGGVSIPPMRQMMPRARAAVHGQAPAQQQPMALMHMQYVQQQQHIAQQQEQHARLLQQPRQSTLSTALNTQQLKETSSLYLRGQQPSSSISLPGQQPPYVSHPGQQPPYISHPGQQPPSVSLSGQQPPSSMVYLGQQPSMSAAKTSVIVGAQRQMQPPSSTSSYRGQVPTLSVSSAFQQVSHPGHYRPPAPHSSPFGSFPTLVPRATYPPRQIAPLGMYHSQGPGNQPTLTPPSLLSPARSYQASTPQQSPTSSTAHSSQPVSTASYATTPPALISARAHALPPRNMSLIQYPNGIPTLTSANRMSGCRYRCNRCGITLPSLHAIRNHQQKYVTSVPTQCTQCSVHLATLDEVISHMQEKHNWMTIF
ncbi:unnamed protein product [Darwinula stevensoni]|uniref:Uncharacterized protein n=1 Tax=Darwinula stevensoni TaxID=69355 RepID=A0A7R8XFG7_9CRUS|nr:unnamed protein product [Darwinula stevensoni]CAG0895530.1 unnamed protein product [Darwinula stevensoni]